METNNLNEPKNIAGLSSLLSDNDDIDSNLDLAELEREIANGINSNINEPDINVADEYEKDMGRILRNFELNDDDNNSVQHYSNDQYNSYDDNIMKDNSPPIQYKQQKSPNIIQKNIYNSPVVNHYDDNQLNNMTQEQTKQDRISKVLDGIDDRELDFNIEKEKEDDDKASLFEQIDMLKITLEDDGIDISGVPGVNKNSSIKDVQNVYKILRLKNDRNRYCSFAEEMILAGAYGLEYFFDGNREWFGRKPDLIGWPDTVKVKLRRMRYETSTFVQEVMQEYNMSSGVRLALELLPSMFLYSRNRRISQQDNLVSDHEYKNAISNLNNV
jgi:hypothetical protein